MTSKIIPLPFALLNLDSEKEGKKIKKIEYLKNEKSFLDEIKGFFIVFEGLSFGEKIKNSSNNL